MIDLLPSNLFEGISHSVQPVAYSKQLYSTEFFPNRSEIGISSTSPRRPLFINSNSMSEYWSNLTEASFFHPFLRDDENEYIPEMTTKELIAEVEQYRAGYGNLTYNDFLEKANSGEITFYSLADLEIWRELEELLADRLKEGL